MRPVFFQYPSRAPASGGRAAPSACAPWRGLRRNALMLIAAAVLALSAASQISAAEPRRFGGIQVTIDVSEQRMYVFIGGRHRATWAVSTGRRGYRTPRGWFRPTWLSKHHRSRKYNNAPMPNAIFFYGGYAIHGTNAVSRLGRPASHGCIRLAPANAEILFRLVRRHGKRNVRIKIQS